MATRGDCGPPKRCCARGAGGRWEQHSHPGCGEREICAAVNGAVTHCQCPPNHNPLGGQLQSSWWAVKFWQCESWGSFFMSCWELEAGPCSTPPARHCHPWSHIQTLQWPNLDASGWHSWFSLRVVPFLLSLDHIFWHQDQQCPGSGCQRGPQASVSGQRDTSHNKGKLRQETNGVCPSVGTERLHKLRLHSRDNRELPSVPPDATSQRDNDRGVPDGPGPPL